MLSKVIQRVNNDFIGEAKNSPRLLEDMASMEKYMAESYGGRVFIELLQNADDAESTKIRLSEYNGHLIFANNGRSFDENDVIAISRSGASSKERGVTIGYRGIGFKSTTYLTNDIVIFSDGTYFTFSKSICAKTLNREESKIPTIRIPFLLENVDTCIDEYVQKLTYEGYKTVFIFKNARVDEFIEEIKEINNGYFLFLRNIVYCQVKINDLNLDFAINKNITNGGTIVSITSNKIEHWLIFKDKQTQLAFKFEEGKVVPCNEDEAVYHSYLPTLDKVIFPIKVNCDFSTDPSRKHLIIDENTTSALYQSANAIFGLINSTLFGLVNDSIFSNILTIFSQRLSFSKANSILIDKLKQKSTSANWIKTNNGQSLNPVNYKILPDWLEESEKIFLRGNSKYIQSQSLSLLAYKNILQIDTFLQQYSQCKYSVEDLIEILKDAEFVAKVNPQTEGKILGYIIKAGKSGQFVSGKEYLIDNIMIQTNNGTQPISLVANDKSIKLDKSLKDAINESASRGEIEWFCKKTSIVENIVLNDVPFNRFVHDNKSEISSIRKTLSFNRWRSAEQQCLEIEKSLGHVAIDVSKQNIGYDVESVAKDGSKRFIEVKLLNSIGSPFSMTNNEYTAAYQYEDRYYLCLIVQNNKNLKALYIKNPLKSLQFEKRIRQWEWYCESYEGEEILIEYLE